MDNHPLTPNKIKRLIHLAEDGSFNMDRRLLLTDDDLNMIASQAAMHNRPPSANQESSSGILDLDRVEAFGESGIGNISLSKYSAFNPGELTGRSTGTEDPGLSLPHTDGYSRYSLGLQSYATNIVDVQTNEIKDIMRNSIATNYSFHSKPDLSEDQASWLAREAPLPVPQSTFMQIADCPTASLNNSNLSVGAYFQSRCPEFMRLLGKTDSPDKSNLMPSITEVSTYELGKASNEVITLDDTLDSEPVKQPRNHNIPEHLTSTNTKLLKKSNPPTNESEAKTPKKAVSVSANTKLNANVLPAHKSFMTSSKPTDVLLKNLHSSLRPVTEDTEGEENSFSVSKIADYLGGKQSEVSISDMLHLNRKTPAQRKQPLIELHMNTQDVDTQDVSVAKLIDTLNIDTASSAGTITTVISVDKHKIPERDIPRVVVTKPSCDSDLRRTSVKTSVRSKSPSSAYVTPLLDLGHSRGKTQTSSKEVARSKSPRPSYSTAYTTETPNTVRPKSPCGNQRVNTEQNAPIARSKSPFSTDRSTPNTMEVKKIEARSKSPSTSQSTGSTVRDNFTSFKFGDSPLHTSQGEANRSKVPSPNIEYKELDNSVDWREVLQHKRIRQQSLGKEQYADIVAAPVEGFVGVRCAATITVTALTVGWLTAKFQFDELPNKGKNIKIELPSLPVLFNPGKSEQFTLHMTANVEMDATLPFTMYLNDSYIEGELAHKGALKVSFKLPVIQAMSADGMNKVTFPQVQERSSLTKPFVIISNCSEDLQLELSVGEGDSMFSIKNVQGIHKGDVNKVLLERQRGAVEQAAKCKPTNRLLCRLTSGNAISVTLVFTAPKLSELQLPDPMVTFSGVLRVSQIGVDTVLRKVELTGVVGSVNLALDAPDDRIHVSREPTHLAVKNTGSFSGVWKVKFKSNDGPIPFKISPTRFEIQPGAVATVTIAYAGAEDCTSEPTTIVFEEIASGKKTSLTVIGGAEKQKIFPIKTNHNDISWVRSGMKEISLKNWTETKVNLRCHIVGDGFSIGLPGGEPRGTYCLKFSALERRRLPILFSPNSFMPHSATLHLVFDKNSNFSRKVRLYGCASDAPPRWSERVVTCGGHTAMVRAVVRAPLDLPLCNPSAVPAFVCAAVHFNLKYVSVSADSCLEGGRHVVGGHAHHSVSLRVPWADVERRLRESRAPALATVTVLAGAELTRRRILRILRNESTGELDTSRLPDHLKALAEPFEGEDASMDTFFEDFHESEASLQELIDGLQELTAHIDLSNDFSDGNNTILYAEDTVIEHHTLLE